MIYKNRFFLLMLLIILLSACGQDAERGNEGDIVASGAVDVFTIKVGDCFDDQSNDEVADVPGVPCTDAHDNEAYYTYDVDYPEWPGEDVLQEAGKEECLAHFEDYVGQTYDDSILDVYSLRPTEYGWRKLKDREVVCVAYDMNGEKLSQSVKDSGL